MKYLKSLFRCCSMTSYKVLLFPFLIIINLSFISCHEVNQQDEGYLKTESEIDTFIYYTDYSILDNEYIGFNSPNAINEIAEIENEYFNNVEKSGSKYYGTEWKKLAEIERVNDSISVFDEYKNKLNSQAQDLDSLHCTMYAMKALQVGLDTNFSAFEKLHDKIYKKHEYAGWSVAYILTKHFNWKAYLIISEYSGEYESCLKNFKKDKSYHVWKQPNIPIENIFDFDNDQQKIDSLLIRNEFGWGFSYQGWHTWITRFDLLKECNWTGSPNYNYANIPLFYETKFSSYYAYNSHIVVFPPKIEE